MGDVRALLPLDSPRAPHIEQLRENARLRAGLAAVTAAVVGVILNLAIWFGLHVIFAAGAPVDWLASAVALLAFLACCGGNGTCWR